MNALKNRKAEYTVFRAYDMYWIVKTNLINKNSVILSNIKIVCGVHKISINQVLKIAKSIVNTTSIKYEPFMVIKQGD